MNHRRSRRRGQILFLEYLGTLPIFALLLLAASSFHLWFQNVRAQAAVAHFITMRHVDHHWVKKTAEGNYNTSKVFNYNKKKDQEEVKREDKLAGQNAPEVKDIKAIEHRAAAWGPVKVVWPLDTMGGSGQNREQNAVGASASSRDAWCYQDVWDQLDMSDVEAMPRKFFENAVGDELKKEFLRI